MKVPKKAMVESGLYKLSKDKSFHMYIKRAEGYTLQEIAKEYNMSRERVRQIVSKFYLITYPVVLAIIIDIIQSSGTKHISEGVNGMIRMH